MLQNKCIKLKKYFMWKINKYEFIHTEKCIYK